MWEMTWGLCKCDLDNPYSLLYFWHFYKQRKSIFNILNLYFHIGSILTKIILNSLSLSFLFSFDYDVTDDDDDNNTYYEFSISSSLYSIF